MVRWTVVFSRATRRCLVAHKVVPEYWTSRYAQYSTTIPSTIGRYRGTHHETEGGTTAACRAFLHVVHLVPEVVQKLVAQPLCSPVVELLHHVHVLRRHRLPCTIQCTIRRPARVAPLSECASIETLWSGQFAVLSFIGCVDALPRLTNRPYVSDFYTLNQHMQKQGRPSARCDGAQRG
eukprot:1196215-Prorocentrum_minimum.AAC.13